MTSKFEHADGGYVIYLRETVTRLVRDKTGTDDLAAALRAFEALVDRSELDGQAIAAIMTRGGRPLAEHRFDVQPGEAKYWRGQIEALTDVLHPSGGKASRSKLEQLPPAVEPAASLMRENRI